MEIVKVLDEKQEEITAVIPDWWLYDPETQTLVGDLEGEFFHDQLSSLEPSELEQGKLGFGDDHNYLLWTDKEVCSGKVGVVTITDWALQTGKEQVWQNGFYIYIASTPQWYWNEDWPEVRLGGSLHPMHLGSVAPDLLERSPITRIIPLRGDYMMAVARNSYIFLLTGQPKDFSYAHISYLPNE